MTDQTKKLKPEYPEYREYHWKDHCNECPHCEAEITVARFDAWYEIFTDEDQDHVFRCHACRRVIVGSISHDYPTLMQRKPVEADFLRCHLYLHHEGHKGSEAKIGDQCRNRFFDERCQGHLVVDPNWDDEYKSWVGETTGEGEDE